MFLLKCSSFSMGLHGTANNFRLPASPEDDPLKLLLVNPFQQKATRDQPSVKNDFFLKKCFKFGGKQYNIFKLRK